MNWQPKDFEVLGWVIYVVTVLAIMFVMMFFDNMRPK